jgi:hypothetical protein
MSAHLIQSAAKTQIDDRLRSAEQGRLAAQTPARRSTSSARAKRRRLDPNSLRAVFGQ